MRQNSSSEGKVKIIEEINEFLFVDGNKGFNPFSMTRDILKEKNAFSSFLHSLIFNLLFLVDQTYQDIIYGQIESKQPGNWP